MTIHSVLDIVSGSRRGPVLRRRGAPERPLRGVAGLFVDAYGVLGSSIYVAVGLVAVYGLGLTPVALLIAGLVFAVTVVGYAEASSMFPEAGGSSSFARHALNEVASFAVGWASVLALVAIVAIAALFTPHYLSVFWAPLATSPWDVIVGMVALVLLAVLNVLGITQRSSVSGFLVVANLATLALLAVLGVSLFFRPDRIVHGVHFGVAPSIRHLTFAFAIAMVAYAGVGSVGNMPAEAKRPDTDVKRALGLLVTTLLVMYTAISLIAMMAMPVSMTAPGRYTTLLANGPPSGAIGEPVLGVASRLPLGVFTTGFRAYVGVVAALVLLVAANACMRRASEVICSLSQHVQLPERVANAHDRFRTPYIAVLCSAVSAGGLLLVGAFVRGEASFLGTVYVYGAMISVTAVQVSVIALRWKHPHRYRPFRVRGNVAIRGRQIPVVVALGAFATASAWLIALALPTDARYVGSAWMLSGLVGYAVYRRRLGIALNERREREMHRNGGPQIDIEFRSILIPVNTEQPEVPWDMLDVAARLAGERRAVIVLLTFTEIPLSEEMDIEIPDLEAKVKQLVGPARGFAEKFGIRLHTTHLRTREPAESILDEAHRRRSEIILLGATGRRRASLRRVARDRVTVRVTTEAPVRVMLLQPAPAVA